MTRLEIIQKWCRRLGKDATTINTLAKQRCIDFLNERQRRILSAKRFARLRDVPVSLTSVADQADYALVGVSKPLRMWDTTNERWIFAMSEAQYREINVTGISGTPDAFVWRGLRPTAKDPSNASSLFVKSTAAGDTTQTAYVEGVTTGNVPRSTSVTLTGTTAVDVASTISTWERVDKFYLSAVGAGTITLHEDSGSGTELALIAIGQTNTQYQRVSLYQTPGGVYSYLLDVTRDITDLAQDTDTPLLPLDFHDLLLLGALCDEYEHLNDERLVVAQRNYDKREKELALWLAQTGTSEAYGLGQPMQAPSQLGSWYGAGT